MTTYLFDTSILIWLLQGAALPSVVDRLMQQRSGLYYSPLSAAELSIKYAKGHLQLPPPVTVDPLRAVRAVARATGLTELPLRVEHSVRLMTLPRHHADPFDRLLISQAMVEDLTMVSEDGKFPLYADLKLLPF